MDFLKRWMKLTRRTFGKTWQKPLPSLQPTNISPTNKALFESMIFHQTSQTSRFSPSQATRLRLSEAGIASSKQLDAKAVGSKRPRSHRKIQAAWSFQRAWKNPVIYGVGELHHQHGGFLKMKKNPLHSNRWNLPPFSKNNSTSHPPIMGMNFPKRPPRYLSKKPQGWGAISIFTVYS